MTPLVVSWHRVQQLLNGALELESGERAAYLDATCADYPERRREVDSLLAAHRRSSMLDDLARDVVSPLIRHMRAEWSLEGQKVSHYEIRERHGSGGMGVVYHAWDTRLERSVALKFLPAALSCEAASKRFMREAQAAAALDHPNICTIYEIGESDDGHLFIAMPFYEGETLRQRIGRGPLDPEEAVELARQTARGLEDAHAHGIVHRDIKPHNLIVTRRGVVKIIDFGIAKLADVGLTRPGTRWGTLAYMSPEQARAADADARTDIWSLGVVLYEMLTGVRPFWRDDEQVLLRAILHTEPRSVAVHRPQVSRRLAETVSRALAKRVEDRFQSAAEFANELGNHTSLGED